MVNSLPAPIIHGYQNPYDVFGVVSLMRRRCWEVIVTAAAIVSAHPLSATAFTVADIRLI